MESAKSVRDNFSGTKRLKIRSINYLLQTTKGIIIPSVINGSLWINYIIFNGMASFVTMIMTIKIKHFRLSTWPSLSVVYETPLFDQAHQGPVFPK